jgi:hypothetical protein
MSNSRVYIGTVQAETVDPDPIPTDVEVSAWSTSSDHGVSLFVGTQVEFPDAKSIELTLTDRAALALAAKLQEACGYLPIPVDDSRI